MTFNNLTKPNSLPGLCHRCRMPDPVCLSFLILRSGLLCALLFVLTTLVPGTAVADCIHPAALWKLEESGAVPDYQDEINPGDHLGTCRTVEGIAVCPETEPARYGMGQRFYAGGQPSGIDIPSGAIFNWSIQDSFSIVFWMKRGNTPLESNEVIIGRDGTAEGNKVHWLIGVEQSGVAGAVFLDKERKLANANRQLITDKLVTDNQWHSIAFVRNGTTSENRLYVDGQLEAKAVVFYGEDDFSADATPINIGWIKLNAKYQYKGMVDEIALYDTALPQWFIHDRYHADARYFADQKDPCD